MSSGGGLQCNNQGIVIILIKNIQKDAGEVMVVQLAVFPPHLPRVLDLIVSLSFMSSPNSCPVFIHLFKTHQ